MYLKVIIAAITILFLYVEQGDSLNCYSCNSTQTCQSPAKITCDVKNANQTVQYLSHYFVNVPSLIKNNFNCLREEYTQKIGANVTYKGCIFRDSNPCGLNVNASYTNLTRKDCFECSGDLCNPAGTLSSSVSTLTIALMGVFVAIKIFL